MPLHPPPPPPLFPLLKEFLTPYPVFFDLSCISATLNILRSVGFEEKIQ
jgi:hypothetical protein